MNVTSTDERTFGSETRTVAAAHFIGAGVLLLAVSVWLVVGYRPSTGMDFVVRTFSGVTSDVTVLRHGGALGYASGIEPVVLACVLTVVAVTQFAAGSAVYRDRDEYWYRCLGAGLLGSTTVIALPLLIVALTLSYLGTQSR